MDPATLVTILGWFAQPAAQALFSGAQAYVQQRLGLSSSPLPTVQVEPLLDKYLQILVARLDEDRIAKLYGAFSKLIDAPKSVAKQSLLGSALDGFHDVARIPERGVTGGRPNAELRCMAFVGMVASYTLLQDRAELIEEKMIEAVSADVDTAKRWLGNDLVRQIAAKLPLPTIICPNCGFQNPSGSKFCNRDGYLLNSEYKPSPQKLLPQVASIHLQRLSAYQDGGVTYQIILDGKEVGTIRNNKSWTLEVQPGQHTIFVCVDFSFDHRSSPPLTFNVALNEKVTLFCQTKGFLKIHLWKP